MRKGERYRAFEEVGLPVPIYGVFDSSCLLDKAKRSELERCVHKILTEGSGLVGVRTERMQASSHMWDEPHYMPLRSLNEVVQAIARNERESPQWRWWYLVNEAFLDYEWNAVVRVTERGHLPGFWTLDGEVNTVDSLPLRPSLANLCNVRPASGWYGADSAALRRMILSTGLVETWLEISKVITPKGARLIFWGTRETEI